MTSGVIELRGVAVHNLKNVNLDLPRGKLIVFCGVSGSGKTSLAFNTLYAEGQRRYIESLSVRARQHLQRLEKPAAERIDGLPPAAAVGRQAAPKGNRATVAAAAEISDCLRWVFAHAGRVACLRCEAPIEPATPASAAALLARLPEGTRFLVGFAPPRADPAELADPAALADALRRARAAGFSRALVGDAALSLGDEAALAAALARPGALGAGGATADQGASGAHEAGGAVGIVVDRLVAGPAIAGRLRESLETAFVSGGGAAWALALAGDDGQCPLDETLSAAAAPRGFEGRPAWRLNFRGDYHCPRCGLPHEAPTPALFNANSPWGACPRCEGAGEELALSWELLAPDPRKSLREGALVCFTGPEHAAQLERLVKLAERGGWSVDAPFAALPAEARAALLAGDAAADFVGLRAYFARRAGGDKRSAARAPAARFQALAPCALCGGARLRAEALAARLHGKHWGEVAALSVEAAAAFLRAAGGGQAPGRAAGSPWERALARLDFLRAAGLGYVTLDRPLASLSAGESQRVALAAVLGAGLVNVLYVLDEPTLGLHPQDAPRLVALIGELRARGNTVVVVEHREEMIRAADHVVELGPGAGEKGGQIVFQGTPAELTAGAKTLTAEFLTGKRGVALPARRRLPEHGALRLVGARGRNLRNLTVEFPLGLLCAVSGVGGAGKSTLARDTLYPALARRKGQAAPPALPHDDLLGDGRVDAVALVDQTPLARAPRSNPATYLKVFDDIRAVFAEQPEARAHNLDASQFSFNVEGGRCPACEGAGYREIDMRFLPDVFLTCEECGGARYRREILRVRYRGKSIAEVLEMTAREAFGFFRGQPKTQGRLKPLLDVGLDYLRLGQGANTLSSGEAQRLKLAGYLSVSRRQRTLFVLEEPTAGLHFADVVRLLDCFDALLAVGHSLVVIEHNPRLLRAADHIIDLGPGAAEAGGRVVAQGSPEQIAATAESATGRHLRAALAR